MKNLTKYELAELLIYSDNVHDILVNYDFKHEIKREFNRIDKSIKKMIKLSFAKTPLEDLDDFKLSVRKFTLNEIKGKIHLKE